MARAELLQRRFTRRQVLDISTRTAVLATDIMLGAIGYNWANSALTLNYEDSPIEVREGQVFSLPFGTKLNAIFMPIEHSYGYSNSTKAFNSHKTTITDLVQSSSIDELWLEALPKEMRELTQALPVGLKQLGDLTSLLTQRNQLIEYFDPIVKLAKDRPKIGKKSVEIVCPDIVGGSPQVTFVAQKPTGVPVYFASAVALASVFPLINKLDTISDYNKNYQSLTKFQKVRRSLFHAMGVAGAYSAVLYARSSIAHKEQIYANRPVQNYVTDDTIRESWVLWNLIQYGERLGAEDLEGIKNIAVFYTPAHIEAMIKRRENPEEFYREIAMYFNLVPREIFRQGIRRYSLDANGEYTTKIPFGFYKDD